MKRTNLMEGLLSEISRVKEMIDEYKSLPKKAGMLAAMMMQTDVKDVEKCIGNGDTIQMMTCYEKLKEYQN